MEKTSKWSLECWIWKRKPWGSINLSSNRHSLVMRLRQTKAHFLQRQVFCVYQHWNFWCNFSPKNGPQAFERPLAMVSSAPRNSKTSIMATQGSKTSWPFLAKMEGTSTHISSTCQHWKMASKDSSQILVSAPWISKDQATNPQLKHSETCWEHHLWSTKFNLQNRRFPLLGIIEHLKTKVLPCCQILGWSFSAFTGIASSGFTLSLLQFLTLGSLSKTQGQEI